MCGLLKGKEEDTLEKIPPRCEGFSVGHFNKLVFELEEITF